MRFFTDWTTNKKNDIFHHWEGCQKYAHIQWKTMPINNDKDIYLLIGKMFRNSPIPLANSRLSISSQRKYPFPQAFPRLYTLTPFGTHPAHSSQFNYNGNCWRPIWCSSKSRAWHKDLGAGGLFGRRSKDRGAMR